MPPAQTMDVDDFLTVSVWKAGTGRLSSMAALPGEVVPHSSGAAIVKLAVAAEGMITTSQVGRVVVAQMAPAQVEREIVSQRFDEEKRARMILRRAQNASLSANQVYKNC